LIRYCNDGHIEIDNNAAERALRAVALGRKNYLFAGSDTGGERAAAIYSLIGSAKLNGLDPEAYLREVRPSHHSHRGVTALEHRRKPNRHKPNRNLDHKVVANHSGVVSSYLPNIADLINYGHITTGVLHPTGCVAVATDGHNTVAMLLRRPDETMAHLLARLDQAIDKALTEDIYTDEINSPSRHP
jgi:Transposase IS66 family